jgi:hypothetical protein
MLVSPASPVEGACSDAPSAGVYRRTLLPRFRAQGSRRPQLVRESRTRAILTMEKPHDATPRAVARCTHRPGRVARRRRRRTLEDRPAPPPPRRRCCCVSCSDTRYYSSRTLRRTNSPPDNPHSPPARRTLRKTNPQSARPSTRASAAVCGRLRRARAPPASHFARARPRAAWHVAVPRELPSCRAAELVSRTLTLARDPAYADCGTP